MKDYRQFSSTRFVQLGLYASLKKKKGKKKERKKKRIPMHITRYTAENKESSFLYIIYSRVNFGKKNARKSCFFSAWFFTLPRICRICIFTINNGKRQSWRDGWIWKRFRGLFIITTCISLAIKAKKITQARIISIWIQGVYSSYESSRVQRIIHIHFYPPCFFFFSLSLSLSLSLSISLPLSHVQIFS